MQIDKKVRYISLIDVCIVMLSNIMVVMLSMTISTPAVQSIKLWQWKEFISVHQWIIHTSSVLAFLVPTVLCLLYALMKTEDSSEIRCVNYPFMFSIFGLSGWGTNLIIEVITMFISFRHDRVFMLHIMPVSALFMILCALFSFTISFFLLGILHRRYFLPRLFPQGNLRKFKGIVKPSLNLVFLVFYISTAVFPILYLIFLLTEIRQRSGLEMDRHGLILFLVIMVLCIVIFLIFTKYFSVPVQRLSEGARKIAGGDYDVHVDFVSSDDFGEMTDAFNDMARSLKAKNDKIGAIQESVIKGMAMMVESRDNSTGGHIYRTSACVRVFVNHLIKEKVFPDVTEQFFKAVIKTAPMHDLGKIAVDDAILRKPGKFTDEEYAKMKVHPVEGARIVSGVLNEVDNEQFKRIAVNVAHYHHEKWNGQGYPEGLAGTRIPFEARIMALADVFDALVSRRCYKDSFSFDRAFDIIRESLGSHFDPVLGAEFLKCRPALEELYILMAD